MHRDCRSLGSYASLHEHKRLLHALLLSDREWGVTPVIGDVCTSTGTQEKQSAALVCFFAGHVERCHVLGRFVHVLGTFRSRALRCY